MAMSEELENTFAACLRCSTIEAIRERDTDYGGYGCVVTPGSGTEVVLNNVRAETFLGRLAARQGKDLKKLCQLRGLLNGNKRGHVDFYQISVRLLFVPLRFRRAVNSHHTTRLYANVFRLAGVARDGDGRTVLRFLSGKTIPVKVSYEYARRRFIAGRELLYQEYFSLQENLRCMRVTLLRLGKMAEDWG